MPFTPAHVAAAIPFRHTRLVPSAVIIGTMAPDFEYFLHLSPSIGFGHTPLGALVLTMPLALLVLWLFHYCVKALAISLMPRGLQQRLVDKLTPFPFFGGSRFSLILLSLLIGIATHLAWDSFTHPHSWLTEHWNFLRHSDSLPIFGCVPHYKVLQHMSTLVGLSILSVWFVAWYRATAPDSAAPQFALRRFSPSRKLFIVTQITVIAIAASFVRVVVAFESSAHKQTLGSMAGLAVCTFIALAWWQLVAYGLVSRNRQRFLQARPL